MKRQTWKATAPDNAQDSPQGTRAGLTDATPEDREARALAYYRRQAALARYFPNPERYDSYNPL
jgi:hypothetical protein